MDKSLLVDVIPFEVTPDKVNEAISTNGGKLIVKGVLQRAEARNQNGRVYPKEILENEVSRYNKEFIQKKRAFG